MRAREKRHAVRLSARMRSDLGWADVQIRNVSARGMLLTADEIPTPGGYLEVRRDTVVIVARIVWRDGRQFGVRAQDRIDLKSLIAPPQAPIGPLPSGGSIERRRTARAPDADRSRLRGRLLQFLVLLVGIGAAAAAMIEAVSGALAPLRLVEAALIDA